MKRVTVLYGGNATGKTHLALSFARSYGSFYEKVIYFGCDINYNSMRMGLRPTGLKCHILKNFQLLKQYDESDENLLIVIDHFPNDMDKENSKKISDIISNSKKSFLITCFGPLGLTCDDVDLYKTYRVPESSTFLIQKDEYKRYTSFENIETFWEPTAIKLKLNNILL